MFLNFRARYLFDFFVAGGALCQLYEEVTRPVPSKKRFLILTRFGRPSPAKVCAKLSLTEIPFKSPVAFE
jgi:hypothetical protein